MDLCGEGDPNPQVDQPLPSMDLYGGEGLDQVHHDDDVEVDGGEIRRRCQNLLMIWATHWTP